MALITLRQAKLQLGLPVDATDHDELLELQMESASNIVLDYLKTPPGEWEAGSPGSPGGGSPADDRALSVVQCAVLLVLGYLWAHRGDEADDAATVGPLSPAVRALLERLRDPTMA